MKKLLLLLVLSCCFALRSFSQAERVPGPAEKRLADSLCVALGKLDQSKITNNKEAEAAFVDCFTQQSAMFEDVANERHIQMEDQSAMHQVGIDIGKDLLKLKCDGFMKLAFKMAKKDDADAGSFAVGKFKRIDVKGFNYIVLTDANNAEKSFIWLRQFPGSEKLMNATTGYVGKSIRIKYSELEVYLPQAKGYYKVKEIVSFDVE